MSATDSLYMVQLHLDARKLSELARMLHLPLKELDVDYLLHCALGELFQEHAPSPYWRMEERAGEVSVLAYSSIDLNALREIASGFASPKLYETCLWERCASKPMPRRFPEGMRIGFEVRATPVIRLASPLKDRKKGDEVDAFLARCWREEGEQRREEVYEEWLRGQLDASRGVKLLEANLERFMLTRVMRRQGKRDHEAHRKAKRLVLPDTSWSGVLEVEESEAFEALLRRGIGRHRAFGFGMVKLRRAEAMR